MHGAGGTALKDSTVAQISAAIYYQAQVVAKLPTSKAFQKAFHDVIFAQIEKDFYGYIDAQARSKPKSLHHVYEWKKVGNENGRLFRLRQTSSEGLSFRLTYEFMPSKTRVPSNGPSKKRYVFANKAAIMEAGFPLVIKPRGNGRLVFEIHGSTVFMPKGVSVTVKNPGGTKARNQFSLMYSRFFSGQLVNNSIKRSGFQAIFKSKMGKALSIPVDIKKVKYSFSPNTIDMQAESAIEAVFGAQL